MEIHRSNGTGLDNFSGALEWEGVKYPSLQHAIYASLLTNVAHRQQLLQTEHPFELKKMLEAFFQEEILERSQTLARTAYAHLFEATGFRSPRNVRVVYQPSKSIQPSKYKFLWGVDAFGYGWNVIGQALSPRCVVDDHPAYMVYRVAGELVKKMEEGDRLMDYLGKSVQDLYELLLLEETQEDFRNFLMEWRGNEFSFLKMIVHTEVQYPGSLVPLLRKRFAPFVNGKIQRSIEEILFRGAVHLYETEQTSEKPFQVSMTLRLRENLYYLYQQNKLPLQNKTLCAVKSLEHSKWTDKEVHQAVGFLPLHPLKKQNVLVVDEYRHPVLSPLTPSKHFKDKEFVFHHLLEYLYYQLLLPFGSREEAFTRVRQIKNWKSGEADLVLETSFRDFFAKKVRECLKIKFQDKWNQWLLVTTGDQTKFQYKDPYDPLLCTLMNQELVLLRREIATSPWMTSLLQQNNDFLTTEIYCAQEAFTRSLQDWKQLFHVEKPSLEKKFLKIFYPEKKKVDTPSPDQVLGLLQKEIHGPLLQYLKKKKRARHVANIVFHVCHPLSVFHPDVTIKTTPIISGTALIDDPFFEEIRHYLKIRGGL